MRLASATYSSRTPSLRRERNTVTIMILLLGLPWLGLTLLLMFGQRVELRHPWSRRTPPDLPPRRELVALAQNAHTQHIGRLRPVACGGRIKRGTALDAKRPARAVGRSRRCS